MIGWTERAAEDPHVLLLYHPQALYGSVNKELLSLKYQMSPNSKNSGLTRNFRGGDGRPHCIDQYVSYSGMLV